MPEVATTGPLLLLQSTPQPSQDARSLAIAESKGSADARQAAESAQRRIDIAVEATKRLEEVHTCRLTFVCFLVLLGICCKSLDVMAVCANDGLAVKALSGACALPRPHAPDCQGTAAGARSDSHLHSFDDRRDWSTRLNTQRVCRCDAPLL